MPRTMFVYDNWSTYDELSDDVPLTEELAIFQLEQMARLMSHGVRFDAYLMDAFWYSADGAYRKWKPDRWPNGPDAWINGCCANGLLPGLWFPANVAFQLDPPEAWKSSLSPGGYGFCCFEGGFMDGYIEALEYWYTRGIRVFKFDFAEFGSATESAMKALLPSEIRAKNEAAFRYALTCFRTACPEAVLCAYNGFEEVEYMTRTDFPVRKVLNPKWLDVFDTVYVGDPRPADLPSESFWRSCDTYADHMVWYLAKTGMPLGRLDNCAFMVGKTGTCYRRGKEGWKETLLLSLARGGQVHMTLGNLEDLDDEDARWFASAQHLYENADSTGLLGGSPGAGEPYGYLTKNHGAHVLTFANPGLENASIDVKGIENVCYSDQEARVENGRVQLQPGSVCVLSSDSALNLGVENNPAPKREFLAADWKSAKNRAAAEIEIPAGCELHIAFRQLDSKGVVRTSGGHPPNGESSASLLRIEATINGCSLQVERPDDKVVWSGLSWAYGILRSSETERNCRIELESTDLRVNRVEPQAFLVRSLRA